MFMFADFADAQMEGDSSASVLGNGDDAPWRALTQHDHSVLYAALSKDEEVDSIWELASDASKREPSLRASGALRTVTCVQRPRAGTAGLFGHSFRVHACRKCPLPTREYRPAKYGNQPPPVMHGKILRLCAKGEKICFEKERKHVERQLEGDSGHAGPKGPDSA